MTVEEAVRTRLLSLSPVTQIVGSRIYLRKLPQRPTYPAIRVAIVDDMDGQQMRGPSGQSVARVQVDHYTDEATSSDPYSTVAALESATKGDGCGETATGLSGWKGSLAVSPTFRVQAVEPLQRIDGYEPGELRLLRMSRDYRITYRTEN